MKKFFLILLICAYSLSTMGVGFKEFYCCRKLKSVLVSIEGNSKQQCTKEGCCKTKYQFFKLDDNHLASADIHFPAKHFIALPFYNPAYHIVSFAQQAVH